MNNILVVNCGSSSLKYQLINMENETLIAKGTVERIGIDGSNLVQKVSGRENYVVKKEIKDHVEAANIMFSALTDEKKHQKEVLMQAVQDSRLMAEAIAEADGKHIKGIKAADLDGDNWEELYEANELIDRVCYRKAESLSDRLKPEKIMLSAEGNVVWICG